MKVSTVRGGHGLLAIGAVALGACSSPPSPSTRHPSPPSPAVNSATYRVTGADGLLDAQAAEAAHRAGVDAKAMRGATRPLDEPLKLLQAPQPVMPRGDIAAGVSGRVVVEMTFDEAGKVAATRILESTKASLSACVIEAVSRWAIAPARRNGEATRVVARQSFDFGTAP